MVLCLLSRDSHGDTGKLNHEETVRGPEIAIFPEKSEILLLKKKNLKMRQKMAQNAQKKKMQMRHLRCLHGVISEARCRSEGTVGHRRPGSGVSVILTWFQQFAPQAKLRAPGSGSSRAAGMKHEAPQAN